MKCYFFQQYFYERCDFMFYVLQQGRVVQQGTPDDVYRQGGLYKEIFDASARSMNADKIAATTDF